MRNRSPDIVVVGAGASGIFAALRAAELGAQVLLVEKTPRIGTKILISGGGKCNVAHAGKVEDVLHAFRPDEARFLRPSVYKLTNEQIMGFFEDRGIELSERPDNRVFPKSKTAKEVVEVLREELADRGIWLSAGAPVEKLEIKEGRAVGVWIGEDSGRERRGPERRFGAQSLLNEVQDAGFKDGHPHPAGFLSCPRVIVCTGGSSYPNSGTTGDAWPWLKDLGHKIVPIRAALAPIALALPAEALADWSGLALRSVVLKARLEDKERAKAAGDLLFTHQGISGPATLSISRSVADFLESGAVEMRVDVLPSRSHEDVREELLAMNTRSPHRPLIHWISGLVPERAAAKLAGMAGAEAATMGTLSKAQRNRLIELIKDWPIGKVRRVVIEKGECVAGGVSLSDVDPKTLKSKHVEGLWICGEALDIAGPVGGYNLQAAFSTGHAAGESAALELMA